MRMKKVLSLLVAGVLTLAGAVSAFPSSAAMYVAEKARVSVHDPSILKDPASGKYYVFGSHLDAAQSTDLQSWTRFTNGYAATNNKLFGNLSANLAKAFAWAGENLEDCAGGFAVWAPDVIYNPDYVNPDGTKGAYLMYFCTSSTYMRSVIAYAAAQKAEGPYTFVDTLIYSGFTANDSYATSSTKNVNRKYTSTNIPALINSGAVTYNNAWFNNGNFNNRLFPNAIDPNIYYGTDGKMYMTYGSWSGGIFTLEMDATTGRCIHPKSATTADGRMIDSYFGTKISGGNGKSGEGPFIEYNADTGYYYLWVTYGGLLSEGGYNMRVFRAKQPTGPFVDAAGNAAVLDASSNLDRVGLKVMGNYKFSSLPTAYMACGHNSVLRDDDGSWYLFHHARFDDGSEYHEVRVHPLVFNGDGWPVALPYEYSGDTLSAGGFSAADIAGSYELINHGIDTSATIHTAQTITLGADGSIGGAATGSWTEAEDSAAVTIVIDGAAYSGSFAVQHDESKTGKRVLTFAAVGASNQTIWGVKTTAWNGTERSTQRDYSVPGSKLVYAPDSVMHEQGNVTIGATALLSDVSYTITNKNSGKVLALTDGKTEQGTNLQQWTKTGRSAQEWRIVDLGNGYCKIVSMAHEGMCVAVAQASAENGINVELQAYTGASTQQWKLAADGNGFGIVSRCSNDAACMDMYDWSTENGGNVNQWEYWGGDCQLWRIPPAHPTVNAGTYALRSTDDGGWLAADGNALTQQSTPCIWNIDACGDGTFTVCTDGRSMTGTESTLSPTPQPLSLWCNADGSYSVHTADQPLGAQKFVLVPMTRPVLAGDLNFDGAVNAFDLSLLKSGLINGFADTATQRAADVNADQTVDLTDEAALRGFLLRRSPAFS